MSSEGLRAGPGSCQDCLSFVPPTVPQWASKHQQEPGSWKLGSSMRHTETAVGFAAAQASQAETAREVDGEPDRTVSFVEFYRTQPHRQQGRSTFKKKNLEPHLPTSN